MAVTKIKAIKTTPGKAIDYITNPKKTEYGQLVSGYNCVPDCAELEFALTAKIAGEQKSRNPNLAYHLIQSFSPNDVVTPEQAHELGKQLADRFLEGEYEYVISTHVDKGHIHNHIIINATSWLTGRKLRTQPYKTAAQIRAISDQICISNELSTIQQPGRLSRSYTEWQQRKSNTSWKAELRKRLNFILARAVSYDQFLSMCKELDVAVDDSGKHIKYRLRDLDQERWTRGNKLADTEHFALSGVQEQIAENANAVKIIRASVMEEIFQAAHWENFLEMLEANHGIRITQGKLGLIYHLPDGLRKKEAELGVEFSKEQLLRVLSDPSYVPGQEPDLTVREKWEQASHGEKSKEAAAVPVKLLPENIQKISPEGVLLRFAHEGENVSVFVDSRCIDFDSESQEYTAYLTSAFSYYALREDADPDIPESEQLGTMAIRGEQIIRSIDRANGAVGRWVDVSADYIMSIKPDRLILSFPKDGVSKAFIDPEDMKVSPTGCKIRIYDNWTSGREFRGAEMREILEQSGRPASDQMWRKYRAYSRSSQHQRAQALARTLQVMEREGIADLRQLAVKRSEVSAQIQSRKAQINLLQQRRSQYSIAYRYLEAVRTYGPVHEQYVNAKGWAKSKLEKAHQSELKLYETAAKNLQAMNVRLTVEPEKVAGMMDNLADEARRCQLELVSLDRRMDELARTEAIVREVLGQEEENVAEDRQQQQEQRSEQKESFAR